LQYGILWDDDCRAELLEIFGGDEIEADAAVRAIEWRLSRDPLRETYRLSPQSDVRLTWLKPYKEFPAIAFSFRIVKEEFRQNCVMERARRANVPDGFS
jgi:hypothetical protein